MIKEERFFYSSQLFTEEMWNIVNALASKKTAGAI